MISIKDYAQQVGVSYEAVRKQVVRYADDLEGHITQQGKVKYLDDVALSILDAHRMASPMGTANQQKIDDAEKLRAEIAHLKNQLLAMQGEVIRLQADRERLLLADAESKARQMITAAELDAASKRITDAERERDDARQFADSFKPILFGLFYKRLKGD